MFLAHILFAGWSHKLRKSSFSFSSLVYFVFLFSSLFFAFCLCVCLFCLKKNILIHVQLCRWVSNEKHFTRLGLIQPQNDSSDNIGAQIRYFLACLLKTKYMQMIQNKFWWGIYTMYCFWNYFCLHSFCFLKNWEAYNHNSTTAFTCSRMTLTSAFQRVGIYWMLFCKKNVAFRVSNFQTHLLKIILVWVCIYLFICQSWYFHY